MGYITDMDIDISLIVSVGLVLLFALIWAIWAINQQMKHGEELTEIQDTVESQALAIEDAEHELESVRKNLELMRKERDRVRKERFDIRKKRYEMRQERNEARKERDALREQLANLTDFLVESGVLRVDFDPLTISEADLLCDIPDSTPKLPDVESLSPGELIQALKHAASRDDNWADRPFSRRYMVNEGPLSRSQLRVLRDALLENGYLQEPDRPQDGYRLTDRGEELLNCAVNGAYGVSDADEG